MATQRLTVAVIAGAAGAAVGTKFRAWRRSRPLARAGVDELCNRLRAHEALLPVVYYCESMDRWLMGDQVPGPGAVAGRRCQTTCLTPTKAAAWAHRCGRKSQEGKWLSARLREAATAWEALTKPRVVVVVRQVIGSSTLDEEVAAALASVPAWLSVTPRSSSAAAAPPSGSAPPPPPR